MNDKPYIMEEAVKLRIDILREYNDKIKKLEKGISMKSVTSRDNIFCTGNDASIFFRIDELRKELKEELNFIERLWKKNMI